MSTLQVANVQFDSTGANRIEYTGNNVIRVKGAGLQLPVVTNATKPSAEPGMMLYNSDTGNMEMMGAGGAGLSFASNSSVASVFAVANAAFGVANTALQNTSGASVAGDFYFPAGANVGIGTRDVSYGGNVNPIMTINANGKTGLAIAANSTQLSFAINPSTNGSWIMYDRAGGGSANLWTAGISQSNGNVGIGTNSPTQKLEVVGNAKISPSLNGGLLIQENGGSIQGFLGPSGFGGFAIGTQSSNNVIFFSNNSERMRITSNGNIGIGTSSPSANVEIYGRSPKLWITETGGVDNPEIYLKQWNNTGEGMKLTYESATGHSYINSVFSGGGLYFQTGSTSRMVIDSSGNTRFLASAVYFKDTGNPAKGSKIFLAGADDTGDQWIGAGQNTGYWMEYSGNANEGHVFRTGTVERIVISGASSNAKVPANSISLNPFSAGYVLMPNQPYLRASATASTYPSLTTGLTIPYNTILEQVGSNYNTSTYRFTAPVAGVYAVYATIEASGTNTTYSNLMICKNGGQITGTYKNMTGASYQMMDAVAYVKCAVSDYISVIYYASGTSGTMENVDARNSFHVYFLG